MLKASPVGDHQAGRPVASAQRRWRKKVVVLTPEVVVEEVRLSCHASLQEEYQVLNCTLAAYPACCCRSL
jgi:hypothetical protein